MPHTEGNWTAARRPSSTVSIPVSVGDRVICDVRIDPALQDQMLVWEWGCYLEEVHANAKVIAAAPELLAAVRTLRDFVLQVHGPNATGLVPDGAYDRLMDISRSAIVKAVEGVNSTEGERT